MSDKESYRELNIFQLLWILVVFPFSFIPILFHTKIILDRETNGIDLENEELEKLDATNEWWAMYLMISFLFWTLFGSCLLTFLLVFLVATFS